MESTTHCTDIARMDDLARGVSPLHGLDARIKILATLVFMAVVMSFPRHDVSPLLPLALYPVVLISISGLPGGYLLRKLLIVAPFAIMIGIFNPLLDTSPAFKMWNLEISAGWLSFVSILIRFILTVTAALALVACTGINDICAGGQRLGLPRLFATQLLFLYRYIFVISSEANRMVRGASLRSYGKRHLALREYTSLLGHLFLRSAGRAERIHLAMLSRGFNGEILPVRETGLHTADFAFLLGWLTFFAAARIWNLSALLGKVLSGGPQ